MRKRVIFYVMVLGASAVCANPLKMGVAELPPKIAAQTAHLNPQYLVFTPEKRPEDGKPPLLIYLHGGGGGGTNILDRKLASPVKYYHENNKISPFMIVVPQVWKAKNTPWGQWEAKDLDLLLAHLKKTQDFDENRVYLTGFSMGGYGTWAWAAASPQLFAAIAPMSGGLGEGPMGIAPDIEDWLDNLAGLPAWIFHGAKDNVVPLDRSQRMYDGLMKRGSKDVQLYIYPDMGHGIGKTYWNPELYDWFLQHSRKVK